MTSKPVRLRYNDATNGMTTIGSMFTGNDNINTVTIKNSAEEFNKVIIEGRNDLQEALPVSENQFGPAQNGENEPEILVEVFDNGSWSVRERCYALEGGSVDDNGNYKNKKLYGHEKYTGEKRVETATISTDIEACMQELMPAGYSLQVPGDVNIPEVNEWSYKGLRENAYLELTRNYDWVLMFTSDLDADNNYIVRFEPSGYGGSEGNIVRGQDPIDYDYWKKKDTKTIVSEVTVKGEDSSGSTVQETVQASNPDLERSVSLRIGYPITVSEAQDIGDNLLQPSFVEHGALQGPLFLDNTVNFTVGIQDSNLNIDDEFTVVEQKDFLHEGQTYFSFEFENEANIRESLRNKGLNEERDSLFPTTDETVSFDPTQENEAEGPNPGESYDDQKDNEQKHDVGGTPTETGEIDFQTVNISDDTNFTLDASGSDSFNIVSESLSFDGNISYFIATAETNADAGDQFVVRITTPNLARPMETYTIGADENGEISITHTSSDPGLNGETIQFVLRNETGESVSVDEQRIVVAGEEPHDHQIKQEEDRALEKLTGVENEVEEAFEELDIIGEKLDQVFEILNLNKSDRE